MVLASVLSGYRREVVLLVKLVGTLGSWRERMLGERQEGTSGWVGIARGDGLDSSAAAGNILISSQSHEEAEVFLLDSNSPRNRVGCDSLNPTLSWVV